MTLPQFLLALEATPLAAAMRGEGSWEWLFPIIETIHVLGLATVFGSILMVDLRLLGWTSRSVAVSRLSSEVLPITWGAYAVAAITGSLMFIAKAHNYFFNLQFELKFLCMLLAGINMLIFHYGIYRTVPAWDSRLPPPIAARSAGAVSVILWMGVVFFGRWIGFTS
jgi:hypothetical protein